MPIYYGYPQTTTTVPSQPPTQYPQQQNTYPQILAFVHGLDGANQFQMGPNSKALLMDLDDDTFYIKTTDPAYVVQNPNCCANSYSACGCMQ